MAYNYKTKPFKHQLDALARSANKKNFAYFMEMGCVDGETEFLSNRGWVKFKDFDLEEWERPLLVAQAIPNPKDTWDWAFEFVEPEAFIKKKSKDWRILHGRKSGTSNPYRSPYVADLYLTGDHRQPVQFKYVSKSVYGEDDSVDLNTRDLTADWLCRSLNGDKTVEPYLKLRSNYRVRFCNKMKGGLLGFKSDHFVPDRELAALTEWELRFMVACIADGTFPNKKDNKCDFYFTKPRKVERLRLLAARAGIPLAYEFVQGRFKDTHVLHCIAPMKCKVFDERWYTLPMDKLRAIIKEVFHWDGSRLHDFAVYSTAIKDSADFIQYALAACGWGCAYSYNGVKKMYQITAAYSAMSNKDVAPYEECRIEKDYDHPNTNCLLSSGTVDNTLRDAYCFRVPSGYLVMRRDNRIFITGNSGKTKVMLDNAGMLYQSGHVTGALILAPKGVYRNWSAKEIPTHLSDDIDREVLVWDAAASQGRKDKLLKQIRDWDGKKFQLLVFNIESLISEKGKNLIVDFIKRHDGNVFALVDESTCIKNHKAKRTKAAIELGSKCKARRIATGSPVTNSPLDLFSQCAFLDKSLLGCGSYYAFKNTYANIEKIQNRQGQHYEKILSYKNLDKLSELLDKFSFRVTKKECLDLPDKVYMTRDVELTPEQEKIYREMYDYQFALLQKGDEFKEMSAQVILTKFLRLHQVLCGSFVSDDGTVETIPNNRVSALRDVLEETSGKVIIWATYLADIQAISEMLSEMYGEDSYVTYFGATSSEDRTKAIELFQDENSPVRFFLGNVQTAGRGITLTAASTVIYYSNNFSLELRQQSEDRAHRLGQKNKVTYVDLVVRGSLDEKIIKSLISKRNIANEVLQDDLDEWISLKRD